MPPEDMEPSRGAGWFRCEWRGAPAMIMMILITIIMIIMIMMITIMII